MLEPPSEASGISRNFEVFPMSGYVGPGADQEILEVPVELPEARDQGHRRVVSDRRKPMISSRGAS